MVAHAVKGGRETWNSEYTASGRSYHLLWGAGVEALLEEAFPAEERRDMEEVRQLLGKTSLELLTLEEEDRVQGLLMLWNLEGLMFLENFAVDACLRGRGIGARMLEYVWEHWKKADAPGGGASRGRYAAQKNWVL